MDEILDALRCAQALGLSEHCLRVLCEACKVEYGSILPPITGSFAINLNEAGIN